MATMLKIKEEEKKENVKELTPEYIRSQLFYFSDVAQQFHHDTKSFAEHEALNGLYTSLLGFRDEIPEKLMGYLKGKRIGRLEMDAMPSYSSTASTKLCNDIIAFAYEVYEWAGEKQYCDIENLAQEVSGEAAKTLYLLSLT